MKIIQYTPSLRILNTAQLPKGTGAKYLLVLIDHNGDFIAHSWKRKLPQGDDPFYAVIRFK